MWVCGVCAVWGLFGVWCVVCGVWCVVCGVWVCGVCGVWGLCGLWCVASGVWLVACGLWRVVCGVWHVGDRFTCVLLLVSGLPPAPRAPSRPDILRLELLEDLQASAQRMESTVNDVLVLRQLDQHYLVPEVESFDLGRLVATTCQGCRAFFRDDVALAYRVVAPQGAVVMMDGRRLAQILVNVLRWAWSVGRGALRVVCVCGVGCGLWVWGGAAAAAMAVAGKAPLQAAGSHCEYSTQCGLCCASSPDASPLTAALQGIAQRAARWQ